MLTKIKETGIYLTGTIGVAIISFTISLMYSRMFAPDDYGYYSLIVSVYNLLYQFFTGWMTHSILRFYHKSYEEDRAVKLKNTMLFILITISLLFSIIMLFLLKLLDDSNVLMQMGYVYLGVFFFEGLLLIINTFIRASGLSKQYSMNTILNALIKSISLIILYYIMDYRSVVIIVISLIIAEIIQSVRLLIKYNWFEVIDIREFSFTIMKDVIKFGYPLVGVAVVFNLLTYSDRYFIKFFSDISDVGMYSYGYNMGYTLFYTLSNAIMLGAYPQITKTWASKGRIETEKIIANYLELYCYFMIPSVFGIVAIGKNLVYEMIGVNYWDSYKVFIITCVSYVVYGFLQYSNKAWELTQKTQVIFWLNLGIAILNIILNILLIPNFGYEMAAWTTLFSFITYVIFSLILSRNIIKFRISKKTLFRVLIASSVMLFEIKLLLLYLGTGIMELIIYIMLAIPTYFILLLLMGDSNLLVIFELLRKKSKA